VNQISSNLTSEISVNAMETMVVQISGKLGLPDVGHFCAEMERLFDSGSHHIEINMNELLYIESGGWDSLIPLHQWVSERNGSIHILNPDRPVHHILICARVSDIIGND
jgi:hypothetical protein